MDVSEIVALYNECAAYFLPFTIVFWLCNFVVTTILRAAFGGKFDFRSWQYPAIPWKWPVAWPIKCGFVKSTRISSTPAA